jgi:hypothetical protein
MTATATLATIRDRSDREIARVQAQPEEEDLAVRIIYKDAAWEKKLIALDDGKLHFMINGAIELQYSSKRSLMDTGHQIVNCCGMDRSPQVLHRRQSARRSPTS